MKEKLAVKDIREMTGLTGAQIAWFHHEKVVKAAGFSTYSVNDYDGYKYYNQEDLSKFQQIAMCYELGLKRNEIRDLLKETNYNSDRVLEELHLQLQEKKERIERHIIAIEHMQALGTQGNSLGAFSSLDFEAWGSNYRRIQLLPAWIELQTLLPTMLTDEFTDALKEHINHAASPENTLSFITRNLGILGYLLAAGTAFSVINGGTLAKNMEEALDRPLSKSNAQAALDYIKIDFDQFYREIIDVIVRYYQFFGEPFDNKQILSMVADVRELAAAHFGIQKDIEYQLLFEMFPPSPIVDKSDYLQYIYNAVHHHHRKCYTFREEIK